MTDQELDQMADFYAQEQAEKAARRPTFYGLPPTRPTIKAPAFTGGLPSNMRDCEVCDGVTSCRGGTIDGAQIGRICFSCIDWTRDQIRKLYR